MVMEGIELMTKKLRAASMALKQNYVDARDGQICIMSCMEVYEDHS